jgi:hypothetical protein
MVGERQEEEDMSLKDKVLGCPASLGRLAASSCGAAFV